MANLPTLQQVADGAELKGIPLDALQAILSTADEQAKLAASVKKLINGHISDRLKAQIAQAYLNKGEDTGSVHLLVDGLDVKVERSKTVTWDQGKLAEVAKQIAAAGDDVSEYVKVAYSVSEAAYKAWPSMIRKMFEPARTVKPGSDAMTITEPKAEAA